jgi:hypothetical protein
MGVLRQFRYEAVDPNGERVEGLELAESTEEVILKLLTKKIYPSRVESLTGLNRIAFERLEKFKELRDKLSPPEQKTQLQLPESHPQPKSSGKYVVVGIILFWLIIFVAYLLC